jgi:hypothetical protein
MQRERAKAAAGVSTSASLLRRGAGWRADELAIVGGNPAIGEYCCVLESGVKSVPALEGALIHGPAGNAITVMHLLQPDLSLAQNLLDFGGVLDSALRIRVEGLDERSEANTR